MRRASDPAGPGAETAPGRLTIGFVYDALIPYQNGGAERRFHEIARRLSERHDVHYVTWQYWPGARVVERDGITLHGIGRPPELYGDDGKRTIREAATFAARVVPCLLRERFDVIDCSATPYLPMWGAWPAARVRRTPMVATWHEYWGNHWADYLPERPVVARIARTTEALCVPMGETVVAVSEFTARRLAKRAPHRPHPQVVENGISLAAIDAIPADPDGPDIISVGRLIDEKRIDTLLRAVAILRETRPGVRCEIIGEGPERAALEMLAASLGISANVRFLGRVSEQTLFARMKAARVFALPSVREGFGIVVVEAQAAGAVPVVAKARYSAASRLVADNETGLVVTPEPAAFAAAFATLLADEPRRRAMALAARAAAERRDWDVIAEQMEAIYLRAAGTRRVSRAPRTIAPLRETANTAGEPA